MKNFSHSLVLLCFLVGVLAPACGFSWGGKYSVVEICTSQGIEQRVVNADDSDTPTAPTMSEDCQFCFASANMKAFLPNDLSLVTIGFVAEKQRFAFYTLTVLSLTTSHEEPRGPPALV
jgi:hypothetical protein